ncbi:hypothetical protein SAMN05518683_13427 [Salibacterium halotolerans]|uniref:Uncharacterized protein n=1 Tax=Salibacterium halotolerans TaxID=1884432 RepID=A0A1I5Y2J2_9BACI|nr:hypothetical protein SAMN05518683_13427 [Salibacterium halotolerans]
MQLLIEHSLRRSIKVVRDRGENIRQIAGLLDKEE